MSHERKNVAEAETLGTVEGNMCGIATRDAVAPPGSKATSRPKRNASEPERSHVRPQAAEPAGPHREGEEPKPMMHGHEKSDSAIVATKPPNRAGRPAAEAVERRAEAKENANRCRTCRTQSREKRVTGVGARTEGREASRQTSEVGAVCRKAARTVLCGGRPVMGVPTAINYHYAPQGRPF